MKVVFSPEAEKDLEGIADYIGRDSPRRAASFVNELIDSALQIAETPSGYAFAPPFEHMGIRRKPYGAYVLFYIVRSDGIGIVRILHGMRDYEAILFPED